MMASTTGERKRSSEQGLWGWPDGDMSSMVVNTEYMKSVDGDGCRKAGQNKYFEISGI